MSGPRQMGTVRAIWHPDWCELDQSLEVGLTEKFAFFEEVPDRLREDGQLVFYTGLWPFENAFIAQATIGSIIHSSLGIVQKIDARGLDYTITLADGTELLVNAEETPGKLFEFVDGKWSESSRHVTDWRMVVELQGMSEPDPFRVDPQAPRS